MNSKVKLSKLSCKDTKITTKEPEAIFSEPQEKKISLNTTPISRKTITRDEIDDERSPFFMRCTQDSGDDELDVIWDWDSPRSKDNRILQRKRILHSSPKIPKKQAPSNKNLPRFNSLKAELEQLANNLQGQASEEDDLFNSDDIFVKPKPPVSTEDLLDDDSFDEEMIKCSQKIEETYTLTKWCSTIMNNNKSEDKSRLKNATIQDDSFDVFLEDIKDEDIEKFSQASGSPSCSPVLTKSSIKASPNRSISRTNSVPLNFFTKSKPIFTVTSSSLVSRRRSEESAKSESIQCSPDEIEKKRQEARAKLEFKKKQQEIEKKRLEAMERLKRNRMQKMSSQNVQR